MQFMHRTKEIPVSIQIFDPVCSTHNIKHPLTKIQYPWTRLTKRVNRTIKETTVKVITMIIMTPFKKHLYDFINVYNFDKIHKRYLKCLMPSEFILK